MTRSRLTQGNASLILRIAILTVASVAILYLGSRTAKWLNSMKTAPEEVAEKALLPSAKVLVAKHASFETTLGGYGEIRALRRTKIASQVSGKILKISPELETGNPIKGKVTVIEIDDADARAARTQAQVRRDQAQLAIDQAEDVVKSLARRIAVAQKELEIQNAELRRIEGLGHSKSLTRTEVDRQRLLVNAQERLILGLSERRQNSVRQMSSSRRELESATSAWEQACRSVERCKISSPYDGVVEQRDVNLGDLVAPGTLLFEVLDVSRYELAVQLPASRRPEVKIGAHIDLRLREEGPIAWSGQIERIAPLSNSQERSFEVYAKVPGRGGIFAPGTFVVASVAGLSTPRVVAVPRTAMLGDRVFLVRDVTPEGTGVVVALKPKIERRLPTVALISEGLKDGDLIVLNNLESLAAGSQLRIVRESPPLPASRTSSTESER